MRGSPGGEAAAAAAQASSRGGFAGSEVERQDVVGEDTSSVRRKPPRQRALAGAVRRGERNEASAAGCRRVKADQSGEAAASASTTSTTSEQTALRSFMEGSHVSGRSMVISSPWLKSGEAASRSIYGRSSSASRSEPIAASRRREPYRGRRRAAFSSLAEEGRTLGDPMEVAEPASFPAANRAGAKRFRMKPCRTRRRSNGSILPPLLRHRQPVS